MNIEIKKDIQKFLLKAGVKKEVVLTVPPKTEMGDMSFACFELAKELKKNPIEVAKELAAVNGNGKLPESIEKVVAIGPYVNFYFNAQILAKEILKDLVKNKIEKIGQGKTGKGKKIMVEFAHPNTHKAFHIGHLRNIVTGESVVRILENAGYKVIRANYQGDVGLHIAKCFWGIRRSLGEYEETKKKSIAEKAMFLGKVYALGGQAYEKDEAAKLEIAELNRQIYSRDPAVKEIYNITRQWSLDYFNTIYKRVGSHFDRLYFESETFVLGKKIVEEFLGKGVFKESQGAIIFPGEDYGLHNRVFLNNQGLPTYEAKDQALARLQFKEYNPDAVWHLVAKEQTEYFKVIFKALEFTLPKSKDREKHLMYGWVSLKEGKMSSRSGQVVLGEWLLDEVKKKVAEVMNNHEVKNEALVMEKVSIAAVKYAFLRTGISNDIIFDINESVSLTGDSGPYLLYIVARIKSIFKKLDKKLGKMLAPEKIEPAEKNLLWQVDNFSTVAEEAALQKDPSKIAHYLLSLAQSFNTFYNQCPILKADPKVMNFRLNLIKAVEKVITKGLYLLGIETVEEM